MPAKYTGIYRCPDDIANLRIRVRLTETEGENEAGASEIDDVLVVRWQEKRYGRWEREFYGDAGNCVTEADRGRHEEVARLDEGEENALFTYTDGEDYVDEENQGADDDDVRLAGVNFAKRDLNSGYDFLESLSASMQTPVPRNGLEIMHLMADLGEYAGNTWLKRERALCVVKFDREREVLFVHPDFTRREPYFFQIHGDRTRTFSYRVEDASEKLTDDVALKEEEILDKISEQHKKMKIESSPFTPPTKNALDVHLFAEIAWARGFEHGDLYVQYFVELPQKWSCAAPSALQGVTPSCRVKGEDNVAHFGFVFEATLSYNVGRGEVNESPPAFPDVPRIYLEVISKGTWNRFRTEGLAHRKLPLCRPGRHESTLRCFRLRPRGASGDLRRFFVGDCSNYEDITWIAIPKDCEGDRLCRFGSNTVGGGEVALRMDVVHQSEAFLSGSGGLAARRDEEFFETERFVFDRLNSSRLVRSVEEVVSAFKLARRRMLEAKKNV